MRVSTRQGFTLVELCIVLTVLSLILAGAMSVYTQKIRQDKHAELKMKMDAIEASLLDFRHRNNRLPCPADGTYIISSPFFGIEAAPAGDCSNGAAYSASGNRTGGGAAPSVNFYRSASSHLVRGVVPVRTLGLPDDYMFDPWGGRFDYMIDNRATATTLVTYPPAYGTLNTIHAYTTNTNVYANTTLAMLAIISHGPNGHGAFLLSGVRKANNVSETRELLNCNCLQNGTPGMFTDMVVTYDGALAGAMGVASGVGTFDDMVRIYTRAQMLSATESLTEQP